jgi:hypothetical protein
MTVGRGSAAGAVAVSKAEVLEVVDGDVDLVMRPGLAPLWVVPGTVPWQQRKRRRMFQVQVAPESGWVVHTTVWFICTMWDLPQLAETAATHASDLVTYAVAHAAWPGEPTDHVEMAVSIAGRCLVIEVCDPDPRWPLPGAATHKADKAGSVPARLRTRVARLGGEVGCVSGATGKNIFVILPLPSDTTSTAALRNGHAR